MRRLGARRLAPAAVVLALAAATALFEGPSEAGAQGRDATLDEVQVLLAEAVGDDEALAELRLLDSVDGRPIDLALATQDLDGADRGAALAALADELGRPAGPDGPDGPDGVEGSEGADPAALARQVLDDPKFDEQRLPRPFKGILERLADLVRPVGRMLAPLAAFVEGIPGGDLILVLLTGAVAGAAIWWLARRSGAVAVGADGGGPWNLVDPGLDPVELERQADDARAAGDHRAEVRLRYEAGLLRLAAEDRIVLRPQTTAGSVADQLDEPAIRALTATFEAVVYGGSVADRSDGDRSRDLWVELLGTRAGR